MEIDSGACSSIISKDFADKMNYTMLKIDKELFSYNNFKIKIYGKAY